MTAGGLFIVGGAIALVGLLTSWGVARRLRGRTAVRAAIERDGYEVVRIEHRVIRQGPLFWTTTRSQNVYYVVARDASGCQRKAWARWGRTWLFAPDSLELLWDR